MIFLLCSVIGNIMYMDWFIFLLVYWIEIEDIYVDFVNNLELGLLYLF